MIKKLMVAAVLAAMPVAASASLVLNFNPFQILQSSGGDPFPESFQLNFNNPLPFNNGAQIRINAEGVDMSENDSVFLNGNFLGFLTHQTYNYCCFDIQAGPGDLGFGQTESLTSFFDVFVELQPGPNLLQIDIDPGNWIVEIETIQIQLTPEPGTLALLGLGVLGLGALRRKA